MKEVFHGEQHPDNVWIVEAYERLQAVEHDEASIDAHVRQVLGDYPDPDPGLLPEDTPWQITPVQLKFRHFAQTLLGTSPDIETFSQRTSFLYSPTFKEYYAQTPKEAADERLISRASQAVDIGMEGLTTFSEQHPEHRQAAVEHMAVSLSRAPGSRFISGKRTLARIAGTYMVDFQEQWTGGYFQDVPHTPKQHLAAECLAHLDFGDAPRAIGSAAIHAAVYAPFKREELYHLRNFNNWLTDRVEAHRRGEPHQLKGYEGTAITKLYSDSYEMLRRAARYVADQGSANAAAMLKALPELQRGQPGGRARVIALANALTDQMNEAYFNNEFQLQRLDSHSDETQLQAFDRILYVLQKELPQSGDGEVDAHHRTTLTLTGEVISGMIDLVHLRMDAQNPVTIGDIVALYPNADPETLQIIVSNAQERFARSREPAYSVYLQYRDQVRKTSPLRFKSRRPGHGFIS